MWEKSHNKANENFIYNVFYKLKPTRVLSLLEICNNLPFMNGTSTFLRLWPYIDYLFSDISYRCLM